MHLERGIVKNNLPWGVSFEQQVVQILTHAWEGEVGLNIDRCIICMGSGALPLLHARGYQSQHDYL